MRVVIIPARGGSKGILKKNLEKIGDLSLVQRAVLSARRAQVDLVIVSTDDSEIADQANASGAVVHNRSNETSGDTASSENVIIEVIRDTGQEWSGGTVIAMLQATSPFISEIEINHCLDLAELGSVGFTAVESHKFIWAKDFDGWNPTNHPKNHRLRRQELKAEVYETGAVYAFPKEKFLKSGYRFCAPAVPVLVPFSSSLDIDTHEDLEFARNVLAWYEKMD